ncbi:MAG: HAMP domain-containing protein [Desulfobacterales bacterium]|nr:HAMP domain-containing protein [Desulfobacterales bacterium]
MKKPGIHFRLLMAGFLLISAATFTLEAVGVHITRQFMHKRFIDRITFLAKYLALNAEIGVLIGNKDNLESLASSLLDEEDVARVAILDHLDNYLVDLSRSVTGPLSFVETPVLFKKVNDENLLYQSEINTPFVKKKIPETECIGKVRINFSTHGIDQLMITITRQFVLFSVGLVFLTGIVFYFLSHSIVREVTQLADTAREVGQGNLELRVHPGNLPETRDLAIAFNAMLDSLEKSRKDLNRVTQEMVQQKSLAEVGKFSMMVAHEVKNPLSIIKSSMDILKKDWSIPSDDIMIIYIEDEIKRLNRLIEDFLLFANPAKPTFRSDNLNAMLENIVLRFDIQYIESSLHIDCNIPQIPFEANVDSDLLTRGLSNIIKNAAEANGNRGTIYINAYHQKENWIVEVIDEGEGIDSENLEKIFEPFFTTRSKGTGLGLAFVFQVVAAHGGTVSAENNPNKRGAVFRVEIPRERRNGNK